ncbi:MAG: tRNA (N6-isopentenyl adenosine(37)-C2)-methylthiotransferase MiaB [Planctomycetota bacterium]
MPSSKTIYIETLGCQMNALDSELVFGELAARGFKQTDDMMGASLVVLNTCSVRQHAEEKVYSRLGQLKGEPDRNPEQIVAVIGCMAERDADGLLARTPHVDILCGPNELHRLTALVEDAESGRRPAVALSGGLRDRSSDPAHEPHHADLESFDSSRAFNLSDHVATPKIFGRRQAYVRITRGCNKYCAFCVVPYTRGPEVHRHPDRIVAEVRRLADAGVVEVTLLGQTVNHYHYKDDRDCDGTTFARLLRRVHDEVPRLPRLRFVTSYPRDFTDRTLQVMAESPRICNYLHLPAQSGSNTVLKRMNRGYTVEDYQALIERARSVMPDISLAGDMIVGFCGETEDDFQRSLDLLRLARYKNCFVFKYSPRPGTKAVARLQDDVPEEVKRRRNSEMLSLQAEISMDNHRAMFGQTVEVLVEGRSKAALKELGTVGQDENGRAPSGPFSGQLVGRTRGDQIVVLDGKPEMIGRFVRVRITAATPYTLQGTVVAH